VAIDVEFEGKAELKFMQTPSTCSLLFSVPASATGLALDGILDERAAVVLTETEQ